MKKPLAHWGIEFISKIRQTSGHQIYYAKNGFGLSFVVRVVSYTPQREALWQSLCHYHLPHVGQIISCQKWESCLLVLERHYEGRTLTEQLEVSISFSLSDILLSGIQLAKDLSVLYNQEKILHLDIKPDNLMVDAFGNVTLLDFGAALQGIDGLNLMKVNQYGTMRYVSPERLISPNNTGPLSDLHSLAKTLKHWMVKQGISNYPLWQTLTEWEEKGFEAASQAPVKLEGVPLENNYYAAFIQTLQCALAS